MNSYKLTISTLFYFLAIIIGYGQLQSQLPSTLKTIEGNSLSISELESHIISIMDSIAMPGLSIAILNDNDIVYSNSFGLANSETKTSVTSNSIFEGASLSKPIFAYFVMKLVEEGEFDLDKPLFEYLEHPGIHPDSKEDYKLITARMVLSHQTGFPNHSNNELISLAFKPGTGFMYSGEAYQYLCAAIGTLMGVGWNEEFNAIFEERVMQPLQMDESSFLWQPSYDSLKVSGHKDGEPTGNGKGSWNGKNFISYASIHSKADDYAKFIKAMLNKKGLENSTYNEMLKEQVHFKEDNPLRVEVGQTGWGLGFTQKKTELGTMHLHTGNNHDFQSYCMFLPEMDYGIVLFTNSDKLPFFIESISNYLGPQF